MECINCEKWKIGYLVLISLVAHNKIPRGEKHIDDTVIIQ